MKRKHYLVERERQRDRDRDREREAAKRHCKDEEEEEEEGGVYSFLMRGEEFIDESDFRYEDAI